MSSKLMSQDEISNLIKDIEENGIENVKKESIDSTVYMCIKCGKKIRLELFKPKQSFLGGVEHQNIVRSKELENENHKFFIGKCDKGSKHKYVALKYIKEIVDKQL